MWRQAKHTELVCLPDGNIFSLLSKQVYPTRTPWLRDNVTTAAGEHERTILISITVYGFVARA